MAHGHTRGRRRNFEGNVVGRVDNEIPSRIRGLPTLALPRVRLSLGICLFLLFSYVPSFKTEQRD